MASLKFKEAMCILYSAVLFVSGAVLIGFAIVLSYKLFIHFKFVPTETVGPFAVIILLGIAHLFITWLGVIGPSKEHDFFIVMFVIISLVLLIIEVAVGIWCTTLWAEVQEKTVPIMQESHKGYLKLNSDRNAWVRLEHKLQCCGLNGTQDYLERQQIPLSCFKCDEKDVVSNNIKCLETYQIGCTEPFIKYVEKLLLQAALLGFLSGLLQVAGVASFIIFYKGLKAERAIRAANRANRLRQSLNIHRQPNPPPISPHAPSAPT